MYATLSYQWLGTLCVILIIIICVHEIENNCQKQYLSTKNLKKKFRTEFSERTAT